MTKPPLKSQSLSAGSLFSRFTSGGAEKKGFRYLRWLGFVAPLTFIVFLEVGRHYFLHEKVSRLVEVVISVIFLALGAVFFSRQVFDYIDRAHNKVSKQREQLATLYKTGVAINSALDLKETIQFIIDEARILLGAAAGELVLLEPVLDLEDSGHAAYFSGFDPGKCGISERPRLAGLNGEVLRTRRALRVDHRADHPASVDLPPGHMPFSSVLSVPLKNTQGECIGAITLIKTENDPPFTSDDEGLLVSFANQAAVAIVNASLYEQVRHLTVLEERERIARGMHDGLGQIFAYLSMEMKVIDDLLAAGKIEEAQKRLAPLRSTVEDTSVDVRETIVNLRTPFSPREDMFSILEHYLKDFSERNEINVDLQVDNGAAPGFPRAAQVQIMYIIQEALANVRKHARAGNIRVTVTAQNGGSEVWVTDDGCGFTPAETSRQGRHLGLAVMSERAQVAGGSLKIDSAPGQGTSVGFVFPAKGEA